MKFKSFALNVTIISGFSLIGGLLGFAIGGFLFDNFIPAWKHYAIEPPLQTPSSIPYVEIKSTLEDPANDILYVKYRDGQVYSNSLFQEDWHLVNPVPTWGEERAKCGTEWTDHPPVGAGIIDSSGVRFERPLSTILRCYVLLESGDLQVWVRSTNVFTLFAILGVGTLTGIMVGLIISKIIIRFIKKKTAS